MTVARATFGLTENTGLSPRSSPELTPGSQGDWWGWAGLGLAPERSRTHPHPAPISNVLLSPLAPPTPPTRTLGQGPNLHPGFFNLPAKKKTSDFSLPKETPPESPNLGSSTSQEAGKSQTS